jgi:hypothetical protein
MTEEECCICSHLRTAHTGDEFASCIAQLDDTFSICMCMQYIPASAVQPALTRDEEAQIVAGAFGEACERLDLANPEVLESNPLQSVFRDLLDRRIISIGPEARLDG